MARIARIVFKNLFVLFVPFAADNFFDREKIRTFAREIFALRGFSAVVYSCFYQQLREFYRFPRLGTMIAKIEATSNFQL